MLKLLGLLTLTVALAVACGGDDKTAATPAGSPVFISATNQIPVPSLTLATSVPGATSTPQRTPATTPGVVTGPEVELTASAQRAAAAATAAARSTPTSGQATALSAAVTALKGADCSRPGSGLPSPSTPCVGFVQTSVSGQFNRGPRLVYFTPPQDITKGLALFKADFAGEDKDFYALFGKDASGAWKPVGSFTNVLSIPVQLPAEPVACARQAGQRTLVLSEIGGTVRDGVVRGTKMKAEEFVLASPGSVDAGGTVGYGHFRITSPVAGWVDSRDIEAQFQTRCA